MKKNKQKKQNKKDTVKWIRRFIKGELVLLTSTQNKDYNKYLETRVRPTKKITLDDANKKRTRKPNFYQKGSLEYTSHNYIEPSPAEAKIILTLEKIGVRYIRECEFMRLKNPKSGYGLRFDFFIPNLRMCIEYDGKTHFEEDKTLSREEAKDKLHAQQYRDNLKTLFCKTNKILLIRLSSKQFYGIDEYLEPIIAKRATYWK